MFSRVLKLLMRDSLAGALAGWIVGVLTKFHPGTILILALALVGRIATLVGSEVKRSRDGARRARQFVSLRAPDLEAKHFAEKHGHKEPVVGKVIEIWAHHSLDSMLPLWDLGVDPRVVRFSQPSPKDFTPALQRCRGLQTFPPPNRKKYGIATLPLGTTDDENFAVGFFETDWNTWMSVRTSIENNVDLRHELSNIAPERSSIPQSMSLQFIVRFANGDLLAMKRREGLASEPETWAFSGEEQLDERDFQNTMGVGEGLFRRAFIEEVFGNRDPDQRKLDQIWSDHCAPRVRSHRIWSFFLEENVAIFQTLGVFQLKINHKELRAIHEEAAGAGWGTTDPEGAWYVVTEKEMEMLLREGNCEAHRLHGDPERRRIQESRLHATSRYRLWRLYRALNRSPETFKSLDLR